MAEADRPVHSDIAPSERIATIDVPMRGRKRVLMFSVPLLIAAAGGWIWWTSGRSVSTDNAYVKQDIVSVGSDVAGRIVAVQTGTTYYDAARKLPVKDVKSFPQDNSARAALEAGHVDAWITDKFVGKAALAATPGTALKEGDFIFTEKIAAAVSKGNAGLAAEFDKALAAILADGEYAAISKKWFNEDIRCR